jgi:hypothetical protein
MEVIGEKGPLEDYTQDGTVDLQGRPVLRSKTGRWKACSFLVGKKKSFTILYKYFYISILCHSLNMSAETMFTLQASLIELS